MKIVVAGGGIAGCVSAIGLRRLGYEVILIHRERTFNAYEGFSVRTVEALQRSGCVRALKQIGPLSLRSSFWNSISRSANSEYLTFRPDFDRALIQDAADAGVEIHSGSVIGPIANAAGGVELTYKSETGEYICRADAGIDARGRFTPYHGEYHTGPKSYSLLHKLSIPRIVAAHTTLHSVPEGWIWQASLGDGTGYIQMTCADETAKTIRTYDDLLQLLHRQKSDLWVLKDASAAEALIRRDAYGKLHTKIVYGRVFQVGDAASSVDPLSGNGVFQSLSMATILPYVIHTMLSRNESDEGVAAAFYKERVRDLFTRYSKTGRDFYRGEEQFAGAFWDERRSWPREEKDGEEVRIEEKAVLMIHFIEKRHVVVTPNHPMGVSYFEGVDILPIVEQLLQTPMEKRHHRLAALLPQTDPATSKKLSLWLDENKIIRLSR